MKKFLYEKAYKLLEDTWFNAFVERVVNLPDGMQAKIASTSLGAGIFHWTTRESLTAAQSVIHAPLIVQ
jgi:hypothetical protein